MTEYEDFLVALYHAKLQREAIQSGYIPTPWDDLIQMKIDALSGFNEYEIEAHALASKNYFRERVNYSEIIEVIRICCKDQGNRSSFTMCLFNRLAILALKH